MSLPEAIKGENNSFPAHTISGVNYLSDKERQVIYTRLIPEELLSRFNLAPPFRDQKDQPLFQIRANPGEAVAEMMLFHQTDFQDPILYGQIADTVHGQVHVLLYILNDPDFPRFDVDRMPDGSPTRFGTQQRNIEAEVSAMRYGLAPGQIRRGFGLLGQAIKSFEAFVKSLDQDYYFVEPLYYHNAVIFERYGFSYVKGRKLMERIHSGFESGGDLIQCLDSSTPFRSNEASQSIRLRSWAIHDHLLGEPYTEVTMVKRIGFQADLNTCPGCGW